MGERKINVEIRIGRDEDGDWWTVLMVDDDEALWRTRHLLHDSYGGPPARSTSGPSPIRSTACAR